MEAVGRDPIGRAEHAPQRRGDNEAAIGALRGVRGERRRIQPFVKRPGVDVESRHRRKLADPCVAGDLGRLCRAYLQPLERIPPGTGGDERVEDPGPRGRQLRKRELVDCN
jgi:hypothetical protein